MLDIIIYLRIFPIHVENGSLCKDPTRDFCSYIFLYILALYILCSKVSRN